MSNQKSANEVMRAAVFSAVCSVIEAYRENAGGVANVLARDLSAVHSNTALSDLPEVVQKALTESTSQAFRKLTQEGFSVVPKSEVKTYRPAPKPVQKVARRK